MRSRANARRAPSGVETAVPCPKKLLASVHIRSGTGSQPGRPSRTAVVAVTAVAAVLAYLEAEALEQLLAKRLQAARGVADADAVSDEP